MEREETTANREEFVGILKGYLAYQGFFTDTGLLLRTDLQYDPQIASAYVIEKLLNLLQE